MSEMKAETKQREVREMVKLVKTGTRVATQIPSLTRRIGVISQLTRTRGKRDFVSQQLGSTAATAVAASATGMGGLAHVATSIDTVETADYVEFDLDGAFIHGWFWKFPFVEGDFVSVAVEASSRGHCAYGAWRESDNCVAVFPHCYRGTKAYYRNEFRMWAWILGAIQLFTALLFFGAALFNSQGNFLELAFFYVVYAMPVSLAIFGFLIWRAIQKGIGFPRQAERIFSAFGWKDPARVNLRDMTKVGRRVSISEDLGNIYFFYKAPDDA